LEEDGGHAVAWFEPGDAGSNGHDFARTIRQGYQAIALTDRILALHHKYVAPVQGGCAHPNQDLVRARHAHGGVNLLELIAAVARAHQPVLFLSAGDLSGPGWLRGYESTGCEPDEGQQDEGAGAAR
jgi:hypothetical protein